MAKLVDVFKPEKDHLTLDRHLPMVVDANLTMIMDLNGMGLMNESPLIKGKELEEFIGRYNDLTSVERQKAFEVPSKEMLTILRQSVQCVGCRRSVELLFFEFLKGGHQALDPLIFTEDGIVTLRKDKLENAQIVCTFLHGHSSRLNSLLKSHPRSRKSLRCNLHSLDSQRSRPITAGWRDVWDVMKKQCKDEVVLIETSTLLATLEDYLRKHRFCGDCRTKVLRAYTLLAEEPDPCQEKGYVSALYAGIKRCLPEKHLHLQTRTEYIANLISRAEPELMGSHRERHAKTLEIAQEEVLTCLGMCVYERLHRIHQRLKEEECSCRLLTAVAIEALSRSFETAVEHKRGISRLELLCQQLTNEENLKKMKKEHKKQRRKKKKEKRAEEDEKENNCDCENDESEDHTSEEVSSNCSCNDKTSVETLDKHKLQVLDQKIKGSAMCYCVDCQKRKKDRNSQISNKHSQDHSNSAVMNSDKQVPNRKSSGHNHYAGQINNVGRDHTSKIGLSLSPCHSCNSGQGLDNDISIPRNKQKDGTVKHQRNNNLINGWLSRGHSRGCGCNYKNNNDCCDTASGSSSHPSSPEGSEIACSDCSHEGDCCGDGNDHHGAGSRTHKGDKATLNNNSKGHISLQEMLEECCSSDENGEESYIPAEEIKEFQAKMRSVTEKRQELRKVLKKRFDQLCVNSSQTWLPHCASN